MLHSRATLVRPRSIRGKGRPLGRYGSGCPGTPTVSLNTPAIGDTVIIDGSLADHAICDMIEDSYDLVVSKLPRAWRRALGWCADPR